MKKQLLTLPLMAITLIGCQDPELKALQDKQVELDCKANLSSTIVDHTNIRIYVEGIGKGKMYDTLYSYIDTASCEKATEYYHSICKLID